MKPFVVSVFTPAVLALLGVAACSPTTKESAGDEPSADPWKAAAQWSVPAGPVGDAQRFLLNAPAFQAIEDWEDLKTHRKAHAETHVVRGGALWTESTGSDGIEGVYTDGKREFVYFQGKYGLEPGDAAATLSDQLLGHTLQGLLKVSDQRSTLLGSEKVDGIEAEIYALTFQRGKNKTGVVPAWAAESGHARVWIAKDDHRPLKVELKETFRESPGSSNTFDDIDTMMYRYDPNVTVTLPER